MGKPIKCVPHNSFINYNIISNVTTTTVPPLEDLQKYIIIPTSGYACPQNYNTTTTTTTTRTTQPPLISIINNTECKLYDLSIIYNNPLDNIKCNTESFKDNSAIIEYQPCGCDNIVSKIIYQNSFLCAVKSQIRAISDNINILPLYDCYQPYECDIILTEILCDLQIKDITCDFTIQLL